MDYEAIKNEGKKEAIISPVRLSTHPRARGGTLVC
jgi:hypothetical protein